MKGLSNAEILAKEETKGGRPTSASGEDVKKQGSSQQGFGQEFCSCRV